MDELYGMTMGGDDFVRKPYNMPILLARIAALPSAQRPQYRTGDQDRLGGVLPDAFQRKAVPWESGSDSDASGDAAAGLSFSHVRRKSFHVDLIEELWDNQVFIDDNTPECVHMTRLRGKLKGDRWK